MSNGTKSTLLRHSALKQSGTKRLVEGQLSQPTVASEQPAERKVQIEVRSPLWAIPARSKADSAFRFASHASNNLSSLHSLFREHELRMAHPCFRQSQPRQKRRWAQPDKDNFSRFVDLHFPPDADVSTIVKALRAHADIAQAVEVSKYRPAFPTDPLIGTAGTGPLPGQAAQDPTTGLDLQWYLFRCLVDQAWNLATGSGVIIADVDAGYNLKHQDLVANVETEYTYNAVDGSPNVTNLGDLAHGTGVLGLAGGASNALGIAGVAYNARLWPLQADAGTTQLPGDPVANAITWIVGQDPGGRRVVILIEHQTGAGGNVEQCPAVQAAIISAIQKGYVVCVAAGNGGKDASLADDGTPIPETGSILVGATGFDPAANPRAVWGTEASNFGARITVSAPGDATNDITCRNLGIDDYTSGFGGTSGAAAKVAGVIALMLEANNKLTHDQVKQILGQNGTALADGEPMGMFLNALAVVQSAAKS